MAGHHVHQLSELSFAITQCFLGALLVLDVNHRAVPAVLAALVAVGAQSERPEPAINAIRAPKPILCIKWKTSNERGAPRFKDTLIVIGMDDFPPSRSIQLVKERSISGRPTHVEKSANIYVRDAAIERC